MAHMLPRTSFVLIALVCVSLTGGEAARAQQADTTQLPEIAPREIEILGERQVALPSLERQPLTGFASPPSIPSVPADHVPYVAPYEQEIEDLPESLPLPETMAAPLVPTASPSSGFIQGGGGRYFSRFAEARLVAPLTDTELISLHGEYAGTEGFSPFGDDAIDTPSDVAEARVRFESRRDPVRIDAAAHGSAQDYSLYGTLRNPEEADRNAYSVGTSLRIAGQGTVEAAAEARFDQTEYTSNLFGSIQRFALDYRERQLGLDGTLTVPASLRPHAEVTYTRSWFGGNARDGQGYTVDGRGTVTFFQSDSSSLEVGVAALAFDAPTNPTSTTSTSTSDAYVVPYVVAEWQLTESTSLFARNWPQLREASLDRLYAQNPYAQHAPSVRPTVETTNAHAGLTVATGPVRFSVGAGYRYAPTYRFFEPTRAGGLNAGLFDVNYDAAQILEGHGQLALQGSRRVQASVEVRVRDGTLQSTDVDIPNFATVTGSALLSVSVADGDGFVELQSHFEGPRYPSRAQTTQLDSYFTLDLEASYALNPSLEILARAENISYESPTRWQGYARPPAQIMTGLRLLW